MRVLQNILFYHLISLRRWGDTYIWFHFYHVSKYLIILWLKQKLSNEMNDLVTLNCESYDEYLIHSYICRSSLTRWRNLHDMLFLSEALFPYYSYRNNNIFLEETILGIQKYCIFESIWQNNFSIVLKNSGVSSTQCMVSER